MAPKGVLSRHSLRLLAQGRPVTTAEDATTSMRRLLASSIHTKASSPVSATAPIRKRFRSGAHVRHVLHQKISHNISRGAAESLLSEATKSRVADPPGESSTSESEDVQGTAGSEVNRKRRSSRRLRDYFDENIKLQLQGTSILEHRQVGKKARIGYQKQLDKFMKFAHLEGLRLRTDIEVDSGLVDLFVESFLMGDQAYVGEKTMAAFQDKYPAFNKFGWRKTPRAHRALKGWRKLAPPRSRVPRALALWCAICAELCRKGLHQMAVYVLISVECYLRPSEGVRLRALDLVEPATFSEHWGLVICPEEMEVATKTQEFDDSLLLDSHWIQILRPALRVLKEGDQNRRLWSFNYPDFVKELGKACEASGVPKMVPYEMRHSGPSHDRCHKLRSLLQVQKRGRWKSTRSLVRYEKATRMQQQWNKLHPALKSHAERCQKELEGFVLGVFPPPVPPLPKDIGQGTRGTSRF